MMGRQPDGKVRAFVEYEDDGGGPRICVETVIGRLFTSLGQSDAYLSLGDAAVLAEELDASIDEIAHIQNARSKAKAARISRLEEHLRELKSQSQEPKP